MTVKADTPKLPSYNQPPLIEVACSVSFPPIEGLCSPHIGLLWQRFQPEYPFCDDLAPIPTKFEAFDSDNVKRELELSDIPPLPRVWFINQDETRIIQIQRDMFIHNWRKVNTESEYPRYGNIITSFQNYLAIFDDFLVESELERIQPLQYDLTYVNQIPQGQIWLNFEDIGKVFPDIKWNTHPSRFLASPQSLHWNTVFNLPNQLGRLRVSVKPVILDEKSTLLFELTVRGIGSYTSREVLRDWFDIAHDWIVLAFADLTDKDIQINLWKREE